MALQVSAPLEVALILQPLGDQLELKWLGGVLQSASDASGPFNEVLGAVSPLVLNLAEARQTYRVSVQR